MTARMFKLLRTIEWALRVWDRYAFTWRPWKRVQLEMSKTQNPCEAIFLQLAMVPEWDRYFDRYHRQLAKFRNNECHIMEVGIYSGGSLGMWRNHLGDKAQIYGVDIEPACKTLRARRR